VRLILTLDGNLPGRAPGGLRDRVRTGFSADGKLAFQDIKADYLIGAYCDIADRVVGKGSYPAAGPYNVPPVRILARSICRTRRRLRPSEASAIRRSTGRSSRTSMKGPVRRIDRREIRLRNLPTRGTRFIPVRHPADGRGTRRYARAAELIGWRSLWGRAVGAGIAVGNQVGTDHRPLLFHGPSPVRRQRDHLPPHVGHGQGVSDNPCPDRGRRARTSARRDNRRHGRHCHRPVRPADLRESITVLMGNSVLMGCRSIQSQLGRWPPGPWCRRIGHHRRTRPHQASRPGADDPGGAEARPGQPGWRVDRNGESRKEAEPDIPSAERRILEFNCTAVEAEGRPGTGDVTIVRHVTGSDVGRP